MDLVAWTGVGDRLAGRSKTNSLMLGSSTKFWMTVARGLGLCAAAPAHCLGRVDSVGWWGTAHQLPLTSDDFIPHVLGEAVRLHLGGRHELEVHEPQFHK